MTLRAGAILGFGHVAARGHAPAWCTRTDACIVAVADVDAERRALARSMLPGVRVYSDAHELLARERIDFVDIATPPSRHAELILDALDAGCHVLCEKPLVTTRGDFERVSRRARAHNRALFTVHNWKHSRQFTRVAGLVAEGAVGRVMRVELETERTGPSVSVGALWRQDGAQAGGGILVDHGWHVFYLLLAFVPEVPQRIVAVTQRRRNDASDVDDTVRCHVEFPLSSADIHLTWAAPRRRTCWRLTGDAGTIELEEDRLRVVTRGRQYDATFAESLSASSHHPDWFDEVVDEFFHAADHPSERSANLNEAECCLKLIESAYASAARHQPVLIPARMPVPQVAVRQPATSVGGSV